MVMADCFIFMVLKLWGDGKEKYLFAGESCSTQAQKNSLLLSGSTSVNFVNNSGTPSVAASQARLVKVSPYSCAGMFRRAISCAQGISGCFFRSCDET